LTGQGFEYVNTFGFSDILQGKYPQAKDALERALEFAAKPTLSALSGETASFLAAGETPIPVSTQDSSSITFKEFGVRLNSTPQVMDGGLINLNLEAEASQVDLSNQDRHLERQRNRTLDHRDTKPDATPARDRGSWRTRTGIDLRDRRTAGFGHRDPARGCRDRCTSGAAGGGTCPQS
jgi:hypothetical protein